MKGGNAADPASWNKYAYTNGDPVNFNDSRGRYACTVGAGDYTEVVECEDESVYVPGTNPNLGCAFVTSPNDPTWAQCFGSVPQVAAPAAPRPFDPSTLLPGVRSRAIDDAMSQLDPGNRKDVDCIGLFSGFSGGMDPSALLAKLDAGGSAYGAIIFGDLEKPTYAATTRAFLNSFDQSPQVGALITLNNSWSGAFLTDTSAHGNGVTILHELVHAFERIFGGTSPFLNEAEPGISDDEKTRRSLYNTGVIKDNCFK